MNPSKLKEEARDIGSTLASASSVEINLAEETLESMKVPRRGRGRQKKRPLRLKADKGYDSDPFRKRLKVLKIDLIVPHRSNRKKRNCRMEESSGAIAGRGKLSKPLRACLIFTAWLCAMNA
jgi:hypothetical protein